MQQRLDAREFAEWLAYYRVQPFGNAREDQRAGTIASAYINTHLAKGKKPLTWLTFFPAYGEKEVLDWETLLSKVEVINEELGGDDKRSNKAG